MSKEEIKCTDCGTTENVTVGPCPFASEIYGDETPVPLCENCAYQRMMEI